MDWKYDYSNDKENNTVFNQIELLNGWEINAYSFKNVGKLAKELSFYRLICFTPMFLQR